MSDLQPTEAELKPKSMAEVVRQARGRYKRPPGGKSFAEEMAEYKREEIALEEAKLERLFKAGLLPIKQTSSQEIAAAE